MQPFRNLHKIILSLLVLLNLSLCLDSTLGQVNVKQTQVEWVLIKKDAKQEYVRIDKIIKSSLPRTNDQLATNDSESLQNNHTLLQSLKLLLLKNRSLSIKPNLLNIVLNDISVIKETKTSHCA